MIPVPAPTANQFDSFLVKHAVSENVRGYYRKWLRYFWDFCHKYQIDPLDQNSLSPFLKKLQDKNQSETLRKQAQHAVSIYYEMSARSINGNQTNEVDSRVKRLTKALLNTSPDSKTS